MVQRQFAEYLASGSFELFESPMVLCRQSATSRPLDEHARFDRSKSGQEKGNFVLSSTRNPSTHCQ